MKVSMGPGKFHQLSIAHADQVPINAARAVRAIEVESESSRSESEPGGSEDGADRRRICATTASNQVKLSQDHRMSHQEADQVELRDHEER